MQRLLCDEGRVFEMNNQAKHAVSNHWDSHRVHLILDYVDRDFVIERRIKLERGEEIVQTRRSIDRKKDFGTRKVSEEKKKGLHSSSSSSPPPSSPLLWLLSS